LDGVFASIVHPDFTKAAKVRHIVICVNPATSPRAMDHQCANVVASGTIVKLVTRPRFSVPVVFSKISTMPPHVFLARRGVSSQTQLQRIVVCAARASFRTLLPRVCAKNVVVASSNHCLCPVFVTNVRPAHIPHLWAVHPAIYVERDCTSRQQGRIHAKCVREELFQKLLGARHV